MVCVCGVCLCGGHWDNRIRPLFHRGFDVPLWSKLFEVLLNAQGFLPLSEFIKVLDSKLRPIRDFMYRNNVQKCQRVLASFLSQK